MQKNMKFLFQGDAITDGNRGRNHDPNHILGYGCAYLVAGELANRYAHPPATKRISISQSKSAMPCASLRW